MYHQGFLVEHLEEAIESLRKSGALPFGTPKPAVGFLGRPIIFLMMKNRLLIELIEGDGRLLRPL